jgi:hypothetical protein
MAAASQVGDSQKQDDAPLIGDALPKTIGEDECAEVIQECKDKAAQQPKSKPVTFGGVEFGYDATTSLAEMVEPKMRAPNCKVTGSATVADVRVQSECVDPFKYCCYPMHIEHRCPRCSFVEVKNEAEPAKTDGLASASLLTTAARDGGRTYLLERAKALCDAQYGTQSRRDCGHVLTDVNPTYDIGFIHYGLSRAVAACTNYFRELSAYYWASKKITYVEDIICPVCRSRATMLTPQWVMENGRWKRSRINKNEFAVGVCIVCRYTFVSNGVTTMQFGNI